MMKRLFTTLLALTMACSASFAVAHGNEEAAAQRNGLVATANDLVFELAADAQGLALYIDDHGKPLDVAGASAKVTLLSGGAKQEAVLIPEGNRLLAAGDFNLDAGTKAIAIVEHPAKGKQTVRFIAK